MKNFIAVFDGYKMSGSTLAYAIQLSKSSGAHLTGVFLDAFFYHSYNLVKIIRQEPDPDEIITALDKKDQQQRDQAVFQFQDACKEAKLSFSVHRDSSIPIGELKNESLFADLIIISEKETFSKDTAAYTFIDNLLSMAYCPVIVVPDVFKNIEELVFLYDGSPSSVFAIKMFSYLFDNLKDMPIQVCTVNEMEANDLYLPNGVLMQAFTGRHFLNVNYRILKGIPKEQILLNITGSPGNKLVVLGAYRSNPISRLFGDALADILMSKLEVPFFIAPKV